MSKPRFPSHIIKKSNNLIANYRKGLVVARKMYLKDRLTINVDHSHRLLSFDAGSNWELLTHETYNKRVNRIQ